VCIAQDLALKGINVNSGGVRGVWLRHGLATKHERLLRLERATQEKTSVMTEEQVRILERFSPEFRDRHIGRAASSTISRFSPGVQRRLER
jgi:hypothetical protein